MVETRGKGNEWHRRRRVVGNKDDSETDELVRGKCGEDEQQEEERPEQEKHLACIVGTEG
jgi:hypothetical protein